MARLASEVGAPSFPIQRRRVRLVECFDVFNTILVWRQIPDSAVFLTVGRQARAQELSDLSGERFVSLRRESSKAVLADRRNHVLENIYTEFTRRSGVPESMSTALAELELQVSAQELAPIRNATDRLAEARRRSSDQAIVFISDMYLPSRFIREQLARFGFWHPRDTIWVSGEAGAKKTNGRLFKLVQEHHGSGSHNATWHHTGDDPRADDLAARWCGFRVDRFTDAQATRLEKVLSTRTSHEGASGAIIAGCARVTRLNPDAEVPSHAYPQALSELAATVGGPVLAAYSRWLLEQAEREGLKRVYFLSRDGFRLLEVTQIIAAAIESDIELRYLYGGRLAWRLPYLAALHDHGKIVEEVREAANRLDPLTPSRLALVLGLPGPSLEEAFLDAAEGRTPLQDYSSSDFRHRLREVLSSESWVDTILQDSHQRLLASQGYLDQEGLTSSVPWAIADVGWRGTAIRYLDGILPDGTNRPLKAFFVGYIGPPTSQTHWTCKGLLWDNDQSVHCGKRPTGAISVIEAFCKTTEPTVTGYATQGGITGPTFAPLMNHSVWPSPESEIDATVKRYAAELASRARAGQIGLIPPKPLEAVLEELCQRPTRIEALALGTIRRERGAEGSQSDSLVPPLRLRQLIGMVGSRAKGLEDIAWPRGSLAQSNFVVRSLASIAITVRQHLPTDEPKQPRYGRQNARHLQQ